MEISTSMQNLNMPEHLKKRMKNFIENQQKSKSKKSEESTDIIKCHKCRDLTFIIEDTVAYPCECRAIREAKIILERSGISNEFRKKTFDNFKYDSDLQLIEAYSISKGYVEDFKTIEKNRTNSIIFTGQVGSGKTHLSMAICNCLMDQGVGVIYMGYRETIVRIKQNIMDPYYYNKIMNKYKNSRVLLIDDLFKGNITGSDINIIFEIINYRYFNNLPVIVSSEKSLKEIIDIDEAIGSRILEMSKGYRCEIKGKKLNHRLYG